MRFEFAHGAKKSDGNEIGESGMDFVVVLGGLVAVTWLAVLFRYRNRLRVNPIVLGSVLVVVVGTVFGHSFYHTNVGPIPITIDRILLGGLVVLFGYRLLTQKERLYSIDRTDVVVFTLLGILTFSTLGHDWKYKENLPMSRLLFFNLLPVVLYVLVKNTRVGSRDLKFTIVSFALFGVYLSLTAFAETRDWTWAVFPRYISDPSIYEFLGRGRGPLQNPIINGMMIVTGCCCAMLLLPQMSKRKILQVGCGIAILIGIVGAYATLTRSIWLSLAFGVNLLLWAPLPARQKTAFAIISCVVAVLGLGAVQAGALHQFKRDKHVSEADMASSASLRTIFLVVAVDMFQDRPIVGHGFGQYTAAKQVYLKNKSDGVETIKARPYMQHNIVLAYLTETGLIGVFLLLSVLGVFGFLGWQVWFSPFGTLAERQVGLLLMVFVSLFVVNGMFHDVTIIPMANMMLFFFGGLGSNLYRKQIELVQANAHEMRVNGRELFVARTALREHPA